MFTLASCVVSLYAWVYCAGIVKGRFVARYKDECHDCANRRGDMLCPHHEFMVFAPLAMMVAPITLLLWGPVKGVIHVFKAGERGS